MSTKSTEQGTHERQLAQDLLKDLRTTVKTLTQSFNETSSVIRQNKLKGGQTLYPGMRPKLCMPLNDLQQHMDLVAGRRILHRQLAVVKPLLRLVDAGLQQGDSFVPGKSRTLEKAGVLLVRYASAYLSSSPSPETYIAATILAQHKEIFALEVTEHALQVVRGPLNSPELKKGEKDMLFHKIVSTVQLDTKERRLLEHLFRQHS